jgi:diadenosine tetraphosphatase ApaH/serine/threonine PP2A family protein phosphatase
MPVGFFGHTHVQEVFCQKPSNLVWVDERSFRVSSAHPAAVMVGSVGMSREAGDLRAAWAVYDSATGVVEFRKTEYDRIGAAVAIQHAGLPLETALNLLTKEEYHQLLS